jgi:hypothetical protein
MTNMSTHSNAKIRSRWYEKDKDLLSFIGKLQKMPLPLMDVYCQCLIDYALTFFEKDEQKCHFIQEGSEKHTHLVKSLDKKRWFDKHPVSYRAFNALYLMDSLHRKQLVASLNESKPLLEQYDAYCEKNQLMPNLLAIKQLLLVLVKQGEDAAWVMLNALESSPPVAVDLDLPATTLNQPVEATDSAVSITVIAPALPKKNPLNSDQ